MNIISKNTFKALLLFFAVHASIVSSFGKRNDLGSPRLSNGPMIGWVSPNEITIWARITGSYPFSVIYDDDPDMRSQIESKSVLARAENDYAVQLTLKNLQPNTRYYYVVRVEGKESKYHGKKLPFSVKTAPSDDDPTRFTLAFGSCARLQEDAQQPIWNWIQNSNPDLFFWLGDNIYGDSLYKEILSEEYQAQRDVPALQPLLRSVPQLAIWDDHDYGLNDQDHTNPVKDIALDVFKNYWANPSYGLPDTPGVFFK